MEVQGSLLFAPTPVLIVPAYFSVSARGFKAARHQAWSGLSLGESKVLHKRKNVESLHLGVRGGGQRRQGMRRPGLRSAGAVLLIAFLADLSGSWNARELTCCSGNIVTGGGEGTAASAWEELSDEERRAWRELKEAQTREGKRKLERALNASSPRAWKGAGLEIAFDLCYCAGATAKMNNSLAMQLALAYSYTKNTTAADAPAMHITSYDGAVRTALEKRGAQSWIAHKHQAGLRDVFRQRLGDLVYLSPDAEETLETLSPGTVYVIGGIVDRTVRKRMSLDEAAGRRSGDGAIPTYRLPINEHVPRAMQGRGHVLNLNTVLHILMSFRERGCWRESIEGVLRTEAPQRFHHQHAATPPSASQAVAALPEAPSS